VQDRDGMDIDNDEDLDAETGEDEGMLILVLFLCMMADTPVTVDLDGADIENAHDAVKVSEAKSWVSPACSP
jgi:hypothetical protein